MLDVGAQRAEYTYLYDTVVWCMMATGAHTRGFQAHRT